MADMTEEDKKLLQNYLLSKINGPEVPEPTFGADNFGVAPSSSTVRQDGIPGGAPAAVLTPPARPVQAPAIASIPASPDEEANDVGGDLPAALPVPAMPAKAPLSTPMTATPAPDAESILKGSGASDREALYDRLKKNSMSDSVKQTVAGLGDVIMNSYGGKSGEDAQGQLIARKDKLRKEGLENFDKTREDKVQDYMVGRQLIENQRGDQAYNITQEQLKSARDPMSAVSIGARRAAELLDPQGAAAGTYKGKSAFDLNPSLGALEKAGTVEATRNHYKMMQQQHEDTVEGQSINRLSSLRGDPSLKDAESKRDASITVYNTIADLKKKGEMPSKLVYYDLLGQMWKARTGQAPTDQAIKDLDQKTFKGDLSKAAAYITGKTVSPATGSVLDNIQDFAKDSGLQADEFHASYMKPHLIKPEGLSDKRWQNILQTNRGRSFADATGASATGAGSSAPNHNAALEWANANPNDPRAEEIKRRAGQAAGAQ